MLGNLFGELGRWRTSVIARLLCGIFYSLEYARRRIYVGKIENISERRSLVSTVAGFQYKTYPMFVANNIGCSADPPPPPPPPSNPCDGIDCSGDPNSECNPSSQNCECKGP
jgi:hypothetical protein